MSPSMGYSGGGVGRWRSDCMKKNRYQTEARAERVAARVLAARNVELRVYSCSFCFGFHVTSAPARSGA